METGLRKIEKALEHNRNGSGSSYWARPRSVGGVWGGGVNLG